MRMRLRALHARGPVPDPESEVLQMNLVERFARIEALEAVLPRKAAPIMGSRNPMTRFIRPIAFAVVIMPKLLLAQDMLPLEEYASGLAAVDLFCGEVPGHEVFDAAGFVVLQALEHPGQPCFRIDAIHAGSFDQGVGHGRGFAAAL